MIPTWLVHTLAVIGAFHTLILIAVVALLIAGDIARLRRAREASQRLTRLNEARIADEFVIREVAEQMERAS